MPLGSILIVENQPEDADLICHAFWLEQTKQSVVWLKSAEEAILRLQRMDEPRPELILIDVGLETMSGLELTGWIRRQERLKKVPVIVLSGKFKSSDLNQAYEQGANLYLVKPMQAAKYQDLVMAARLLGARLDSPDGDRTVPPTGQELSVAMTGITDPLFDQAFYHAPIGMALVDLQGRWLKVNPALCRIVGHDEGELLATDFQAITHPADLVADLEQVKSLIAGRMESYTMEKRYYHKRGHPIWVELNVSLVRDGQNCPWFFISQIQDIRERKHFQELARQSKRALEVVLENIPDIVVQFAPDGRIIYANENFAAKLALPVKDLIGRMASELPLPEDQAAVVAAIVRGVFQSGARTEHNMMLSLSGEDLHTWSVLTPQTGNHGRIESVLMVIRNITARVEAERKLQETITELKAALDTVKQLEGILPICSYCKKVRDDSDYWHQVDSYVAKHSGLQFSHGICPDCVPIMKRQIEEYRQSSGAAKKK